MGRTALLTDHYELTMLAATLRDGTASRRCVFEVFARRLPEGRRYGVVAGTERVLDAIADFRFDEPTLRWLTTSGVIEEDTARWLADYTFGGRVTGYAEGECYLPYSPLLQVEGTFAECVLLETVVLSILNHDSAVAAAGSRVVLAAAGRGCIEMGSRRTHEQAAIAAARAAYIVGFDGTSNLAAGEVYGIPTRGTSAHAFSLVHDTEEDAFRSQVATLGPSTTLLVDTFDVEEGVRRAIEVGGPSLGAVRIDSGDLGAQSRRVRALLDEHGLNSTRIVATSDLDEHRVAALAAAPVDAYGVGTRLVTGCGAPTAELVYKLVARESASGEMVGVVKRSQRKASHPGRKYASRVRADGTATREIVYVGEGRPELDVTERDLMVTMMQRGEREWRDDLGAARRRHAASRAELPGADRDLSPGRPSLTTEYRSI